MCVRKKSFTRARICITKKNGRNTPKVSHTFWIFFSNWITYPEFIKITLQSKNEKSFQSQKIKARFIVFSAYYMLLLGKKNGLKGFGWGKMKGLRERRWKRRQVCWAIVLFYICFIDIVVSAFLQFRLVLLCFTRFLTCFITLFFFFSGNFPDTLLDHPIHICHPDIFL